MREFGSEFDCLPAPDNYFTGLRNEFKNCEFLRSGREAIALALCSIAEKKRESKLVVLLPSYICPSMVSPFEHFSCKIHYYNLNLDFSVNQNDLMDKFKTYNPNCILIVNYFGVTFENTILDPIKTADSNVQIIYDVTHSVLSISKILLGNVDYYVASLRKWFGIADGGILFSNSFVKTDVIMHTSDTEFSKLREDSLEMKRQYLSNKDILVKVKFKNQLRKAELFLEDNTINSLSELSHLKLNLINVSNIRKKRNINFKHLWNEIKTLPKIEFAIIVEDSKLNDYYFMLPLLLNNRDSIQKKTFRTRLIYSSNLEDTRTSKTVSERFKPIR